MCLDIRKLLLEAWFFYLRRWASRDVLRSLSMGSRAPLNAANLAALSGFTTLTTLACTVVKFLPSEIGQLQSLRGLCISWASGGDEGMRT